MKLRVILMSVCVLVGMQAGWAAGGGDEGDEEKVSFVRRLYPLFEGAARENDVLSWYQHWPVGSDFGFTRADVKRGHFLYEGWRNRNFNDCEIRGKKYSIEALTSDDKDFMDCLVKNKTTYPTVMMMHYIREFDEKKSKIDPQETFKGTFSRAWEAARKGEDITEHLDGGNWHWLQNHEM